MYQLPDEFNVSAFYNARQGYPFERTITSPSRANGAGTASLLLDNIGDSRLPNYQNLDFHVERPLKFGTCASCRGSTSSTCSTRDTEQAIRGTQNSSNANNIQAIVAPRVLPLRRSRELVVSSRAGVQACYRIERAGASRPFFRHPEALLYCSPQSAICTLLSLRGIPSTTDTPCSADRLRCTWPRRGATSTGTRAGRHRPSAAAPRMSAFWTDRACFRKSSLAVAVAEPQADPADARIDRQNRVVGRKQQHPVGAGLAELRKRLQRPTRGGERTADDRRQIRRAAEQVDAGSQRVQPLLRDTGRRARRCPRASSAARATSRPASARGCA